MLYVLYAIILITILAVQFKLHAKYQVNTYQAIVVNYILCIILSYTLVADLPEAGEIVRAEWFPFSVLLGLLFISGFNILAVTIDVIGMAMAAVFQKISMIIPVVLAIILFYEKTGIIKIAGIMLACIAILLTYEKSKNKVQQADHHLSLLQLLAPPLTFVIGGVIDYIFFYVKKVNLVRDDDMLFSGTSFGMAALFGSLGLLYLLASKKVRLNKQSMIAGILLGIPNVFSLYYVLKSLGVGIEGSVIFPLINIGVILVSTIVGISFFKEKLSIRKIWAIGIAVVSILLISFQI